MKPLFRIIVVSVFLAILASCGGKQIVPEIRINGLAMPNEADNAILSTSEKKQVKVIWHYLRVYERKLQSQNLTEVVQEKQPLDMSTPKTLPSDTLEVGINIFVFNPHFLRYRIVMFDPNERKIYEGIRDNYGIFLKGPIAKNRQWKINAKIDLLDEKGSFVVDSANTDDLIYSID